MWDLLKTERRVIILRVAIKGDYSAAYARDGGWHCRDWE
jgi:hypothetical protein